MVESLHQNLPAFARQTLQTERVLKQSPFSSASIQAEALIRNYFSKMKFVKPYEWVSMKDLGLVGGKNASLGEMIQNLSDKQVRVPSGVALTSEAFRLFMKENQFEQRINALLATHKVKEDLKGISDQIKQMILNGVFPKQVEQEIRKSYEYMELRYGQKNLDVAVRSSATAEDLPDASFAGQQDTYLNISGIEKVLKACKQTYASLFNNRAISYRVDKNYHQFDVALSVGIQKMVRSDLACSGVAFTLDTESGFRDVIYITSALGLGELVVQGSVIPDEFYVHKSTFRKGYKSILTKRLGNKAAKMIYYTGEDTSKESTQTISTSEEERNSFSLNEEEILELSRMAVIIEDHYSSIKNGPCPMDIEWAKCGKTNEIYIIQARPETVQSLKPETESFIENYKLSPGKHPILCTGKSVGSKIASGRARLFNSVEEMRDIESGDILITQSTDPDMEPYMARCSGIITALGGRTCHAAIISRELGIPAIVGATDCLTAIKDGEMITIDCHLGDQGFIYKGKIPFEVERQEINLTKRPHFKIMMNVGNPSEAFTCAKLPNDGVGLARMEFIINNTIQVHPMALIHLDKVTEAEDRNKIKQLLQCDAKYLQNPQQYFVDRLAQEAATIAAAFYPKDVIIRMSDFKSNEYRQLIAGKYFEPLEENPMIGFRGASRYYDDLYKEAFILECKAMKKMREEMGLFNVKLMIPFCRTVDEARQVIQIMASQGLVQGKEELELYMMCEIPANVILIDEFAQLFDGFSIGSNDLTQTTLAVDRDSALIAHLFDERNDAVKKMLSWAIQGAKRNNRKIGICGQAPSDHPEMAEFLIKEGIDSISLISDTVVKTFLKYSV